MEPVDRHPFAPDASFDGGDLDCGNGLLLLIRQHMDPMERGQLLEFRSIEISVDEEHEAIEPIEKIAVRARRAVELFGPDRVLLTSDCGFATFADTPVASALGAEDKLRAIVQAAALVRRG